MGTFVLGDDAAFVQAPQYVAHYGAADAEMRGHAAFAQPKAPEWFRRFDGSLCIRRHACPAGAADVLRRLGQNADIQPGEAEAASHRHQRRVRGGRHDIASPFEALDVSGSMQPAERHLDWCAAYSECLGDGAFKEHEPGGQAMLHQMQLEHLIDLVMKSD